MMVNPYDDSRLMLALQIDHSRVAGLFAAIGETKTLPGLSHTRPLYWQLRSMISAGGNGK